jgi:hypothetical protein
MRTEILLERWETPPKDGDYRQSMLEFFDYFPWSMMFTVVQFRQIARKSPACGLYLIGGDAATKLRRRIDGWQKLQDGTWVEVVDGHNGALGSVRSATFA